MAQNLEAKGAVRKGKAAEWNTFVITALEDIEGALGGIVVGFDGTSKPKLEFEYETQKVIVKYWPELPGPYRLEIQKGGRDIPGSPFKVKISPSHEADPDKIRVSGPGLTKAKPNAGNEITVDVAEAYIVGKLKAYMSGKTFPMRKYGKPDIYVDDDTPGVHQVKFVPKFAGDFKLFLEFDKLKVPGSPFAINVQDPNGPPVPEKWPVRCTPKRVLFSTPKPQQVSITVTPCQ